VGLGIATMYAPARDVMLVFVVLAAAAIAASVRPLVRAGGHASSAGQVGQVSDIHEVVSR
jgi:hypothetical protein